MMDLKTIAYNNIELLANIDVESNKFINVKGGFFGCPETILLNFEVVGIYPFQSR